MAVHWKTARRLAEALREYLETDRTLTVMQVVRRFRDFDINRDDARKIAREAGCVTKCVRVSPAKGHRPETHEICYIPSVPPYPRALPHILGLAEMRTVLGGRAVRWRHMRLANPTVRGKHEIPDALYETPSGDVVAVEYDHGWYTRGIILSKSRYAAEYTGKQLWCTPLLRRALAISSLVPDAEVWYVSWVTGEAEEVRRGLKLKLQTHAANHDGDGTATSL